ncbi:MAG: response regulator transcription factor [Lachnospiraceae bacterium]|nr:response regulator transcription factor [Lachnospiraceae bacterium]
MNVLVVEDDTIILEGLQISLEQEGYQVISASTMKDALDIVNSEQELQICLLDVMLPDGDGYQICKAVRAKSQIPILFLTACDDEVHTVLALEQGADDYIAKPFRIRELLARMKAILRRSGMMNGATNGGANEVASGNDSGVVTIGDTEVNLNTAKCFREGEEIVLTAMEYKLLLIFIRHRGKNLSRQQILGEIWDEAGDFVNDNTLSVYIKRLRKKLGDSEESQLIQTVRGIGYRMD